MTETHVFVTAFSVENITHFLSFVNPAGRKGEKVGTMTENRIDFLSQREEKRQKISKKRFP
jgi:hypothetical protein